MIWLDNSTTLYCDYVLYVYDIYRGQYVKNRFNNKLYLQELWISRNYVPIASVNNHFLHDLDYSLAKSRSRRPENTGKSGRNALLAKLKDAKNKGERIFKVSLMLSTAFSCA